MLMYLDIFETLHETTYMKLSPKRRQAMEENMRIWNVSLPSIQSRKVFFTYTFHSSFQFSSISHLIIHGPISPG